MQKTLNKLNGLFALLAAFALLALTVLSPVSALAKSQSASSVNSAEYVLDYYGIISDSSTYSSMESQAAQATKASKIGVYLIYTDVVEGDSVRDCAKNYYSELGLGVGSDNSGVLFFIAVDDRKMVTITKGAGVKAFTDNRIAEMEKKEKSLLSDDEFLEAGQKYLDLAEETTAYYAKNGTGMDSTDGTTEDYDYDDKLTPTERLEGALIAGLIAFIIVLILVRKFLKGQLKSVETGHDANDYLTGAIELTGKHEQFMGTTVSVVHHSKDSGSGGSSCDSGGFGGSSGSSF